VDLFWVRVHGSDDAPDARLLAGVRQTLLEQTRCVDEYPQPSLVPAPLDPIPAVRAFFDTDELAEGRYLLIVEAPDYPGLLLTIARALLIEGMEILESKVRTEAWRARDTFLVCDAHGVVLGPERLASARQAVVSAVRTRH
jgi:UTP:GlnB (protein PII) uridylyltransferase